MHPKWFAGFLKHQQVLPIRWTYLPVSHPRLKLSRGSCGRPDRTVQMRRGSLWRWKDKWFFILFDFGWCVCVMDLVCFDSNLSETNSGSTTKPFEHQNYSQSQNKPFLRNPSSEAKKSGPNNKESWNIRSARSRVKTAPSTTPTWPTSETFHHKNSTKTTVRPFCGLKKDGASRGAAENRGEQRGRMGRLHMGVSLNGGTPKSCILIGFSFINHPLWGTTILGNPHICTSFHPPKKYQKTQPKRTNSFLFVEARGDGANTAKWACACATCATVCAKTKVGGAKTRAAFSSNENRGHYCKLPIWGDQTMQIYGDFWGFPF